MKSDPKVAFLVSDNHGKAVFLSGMFNFL